MASTERRHDADVVALDESHLAGCLALSRSANWNQNEADWRLMLGFGRGWGISTADGILAASTLALPYGREFAWLAMVLVLPGQRRQGYASRLLRVALAEMQAQQRVVLLDATPAGHEVYIQEGFRDYWSFKRFALKSGVSVSRENEIRELEAKDWEAVLSLDAVAFGGSRDVVLRNLAVRQPRLANDGGHLAYQRSMGCIAQPHHAHGRQVPLEPLRHHPRTAEIGHFLGDVVREDGDGVGHVAQHTGQGFARVGFHERHRHGLAGRGEDAVDHFAHRRVLRRKNPLHGNKAIPFEATSR